jgi:pimeloyl-ACP methyl ester carboxylesterase
LGQDRVHVLGHSHGGFVAQQYALDHPDRIAGLVLYDTSCRGVSSRRLVNVSACELTREVAVILER